jgi:hypothetical protein
MTKRYSLVWRPPNIVPWAHSPSVARNPENSHDCGFALTKAGHPPILAVGPGAQRVRGGRPLRGSHPMARSGESERSRPGALGAHPPIKSRIPPRLEESPPKLGRRATFVRLRRPVMYCILPLDPGNQSFKGARP